MSGLTKQKYKLARNLHLILQRQYSNEISKNHYDIIIAGGGMVGTTLASTLGINTKLSNKRILLLEGNNEFRWQKREEYGKRISALSPGAIDLMKSIGAWDLMKEIRVGPVKNMQVWDGLSDAMITFNKDNLSDTIAYIVENNVIVHAVTEVVRDKENVDIIHKAKIKNYKLPELHQNDVEVEMENGEKYKCSLLLGCDGANSKVRKAMGVQYLSWDYHQMGVVATLKLAEGGDNTTAWQRFLPTGPLALLPLNDDHTGMIWTTTHEHAKKLLRLPMDQLVDEINSALVKVYKKNPTVNRAMQFVDSVLDTVNLRPNAARQLPPCFIDCYEKSRAAFPLGFGHATNYVAKGVALVGDAAHRIHPLAGQGVNLGFGDVACLNEMITNTVSEGKNIATSMHYLRQYETLRQRHNVPTMLGIEGLHNIYGTDIGPIVLARSLGLQVIHALTPVKNFFVNYASR